MIIRFFLTNLIVFLLFVSVKSQDWLCGFKGIEVTYSGSRACIGDTVVFRVVFYPRWGRDSLDVCQYEDRALWEIPALDTIVYAGLALKMVVTEKWPSFLVSGKVTFFPKIPNIVRAARGDIFGISFSECAIDSLSLAIDQETICAGSCVRMSYEAVGFIRGQQWTMPGGHPAYSEDSAPTVCYDHPGIYPVQLIAWNNEDQDTLYYDHVIEVVEAYALPDDTSTYIVDGGQPMQLSACAQAEWYDWQIPSVDCHDCSSVTWTPQEPMLTSVILHRGPCVDTCMYEIKLRESKVYLPSAFSPNNDGINDIWQPYTQNVRSLSIQIYNRWGALVYEQRGTNLCWDGRIRGQEAPEATYAVVFSYESLEDGQLKQQRVALSLIR